MKIRIKIKGFLVFLSLWVKKELPSLLGVIFIIMAIETWEDAKTFGYAEYRKELLELAMIVFCFMIVFLFLYKKDEK